MSTSRPTEDPEHHGRRLKLALDRARALADPQRVYGSGWSARAARPGDLSVAAGALRD